MDCITEFSSGHITFGYGCVYYTQVPELDVQFLGCPDMYSMYRYYTNIYTILDQLFHRDSTMHPVKEGNMDKDKVCSIAIRIFIWRIFIWTAVVAISYCIGYCMGRGIGQLIGWITYVPS